MVRVSLLKTYFLFPFAIDKERVMAAAPQIWRNKEHWVDGIEDWVQTSECLLRPEIREKMGPWVHSPYTQFDLDSQAYSDMLSFHPFVRKVFFDTKVSNGQGCEGQESLLRCYSMPAVKHQDFFIQVKDSAGKSSHMKIEDLRLFLFANGMGILSFGLCSRDIAMTEALWLNRMIRRVYPSSRAQLAEGKSPSSIALVAGKEGAFELLSDEGFESGELDSYCPPLTQPIRDLLYFLDYGRRDYHPVLGERMVVYSFLTIAESHADRRSEFDLTDPDTQALLHRIFNVELYGKTPKHDLKFVEKQLEEQVDSRDRNKGIIFGNTPFSAIFVCNQSELDPQQEKVAFRRFASRYYLIAIIALFYRGSLLAFEEQTALVAKRLYRELVAGTVDRHEVEMAKRLMAEFLHFSVYWYFSELSNREEELTLFERLSSSYRLETLRQEIDEEVHKLSQVLDAVSQGRNTDAINRVAMLSMIFGCGALVTGFFGMNFGHEFAQLFFQPTELFSFHWLSIGFVTLFALGALMFGLFLVILNWQDYQDILAPKNKFKRMGKKRASLLQSQSMYED